MSSGVVSRRAELTPSRATWTKGVCSQRTPRMTTRTWRRTTVARSPNDAEDDGASEALASAVTDNPRFPGRVGQLYARLSLPAVPDSRRQRHGQVDDRAGAPVDDLWIL